MKLFKDLPRDEQIELFKACLDAKPLQQSRDQQQWFEVGNPNWNDRELYIRVKPTPVTYPTVDWSLLKDEWIAIAKDENGKHYAYTGVPQEDRDVWSRGNQSLSLSSFNLVTDNTCNWKDSLILRPNVWIPHTRDTCPVTKNREIKCRTMDGRESVWVYVDNWYWKQSSSNAVTHFMVQE